MTAAYEAVRAVALGEGAGTAPSGGGGVIVHAGVPAWLAMWAASPSPGPAGASQATDLPSVVSALQSDLVLVLASMALNHAPAVQP
ncbi:MAG: hypothetical protein JOZ41_19630 [Chloroflexi bacterium]|nr:hypothetical protein [Chloroflexota bacterium]